MLLLNFATPSLVLVCACYYCLERTAIVLQRYILEPHYDDLPANIVAVGFSNFVLSSQVILIEFLPKIPIFRPD